MSVSYCPHDISCNGSSSLGEAGIRERPSSRILGEAETSSHCAVSQSPVLKLKGHPLLKRVICKTVSEIIFQIMPEASMKLLWGLPSDKRYRVEFVPFSWMRATFASVDSLKYWAPHNISLKYMTHCYKSLNMNIYIINSGKMFGHNCIKMTSSSSPF